MNDPRTLVTCPLCKGVKTYLSPCLYVVDDIMVNKQGDFTCRECGKIHNVDDCIEMRCSLCEDNGEITQNEIDEYYHDVRLSEKADKDKSDD